SAPTDKSPEPMWPSIDPESLKPAWQRYAVAIPDTAGKPMIALVIDDMGMDRDVSRRLINMSGPLTLSFLPSSPGLSAQVPRAREAGHEIMAHIPMEPQRAEFDPGPNFLGIDQTDEQLLSRLDWNLRQIDGIVGVNNHMGSRFTSDPRLMKVVLE